MLPDDTAHDSHPWEWLLGQWLQTNFVPSQPQPTPGAGENCAAAEAKVEAAWMNLSSGLTCTSETP